MCSNLLRMSGPGRVMFFQVENRGGVHFRAFIILLFVCACVGVYVCVVSVTITEIPNKYINQISQTVFSSLLKQNSEKSDYLLTTNRVSSSSPGRIREFNGPHMAPGP